MFDTLVPIVLFLSGAYVVVNVVRALADTVVRLRALKAGLSPAIAASLAASPGHEQLAPLLQWAIVAAGVGLALIVVQFLPYSPEEPISIGLVLLFGSAGVLVYHAVAARRLPLDRADRIQPAVAANESRP